MKKGIVILASALLLFNGVGAVYGGWNLMVHPDGSSMQLSTGWLTHSMFHDFLIPGIILFVANGLSSLFILATILAKYKHYTWLVMGQGIILIAWILVQVFIMQTIVYFQVLLAIIGVLLVVCGYILKADPLLKRPVQ